MHVKVFGMSAFSALSDLPGFVANTNIPEDTCWYMSL